MHTSVCGAYLICWLSMCIIFIILNDYSPKWIKFHGEEYHFGDYIVIGKQVDDLPISARIVDIFVIFEYPLVEVKVCRTVGLFNHLISYQLETTLQSFGVALSTLAENYPYTAHTFDDGKLYITIRSRVNYMMHV